MPMQMWDDDFVEPMCARSEMDGCEECGRFVRSCHCFQCSSCGRLHVDADRDLVDEWVGKGYCTEECREEQEADAADRDDGSVSTTTES